MLARVMHLIADSERERETDRQTERERSDGRTTGFAGRKSVNRVVGSDGLSTSGSHGRWHNGDGVEKLKGVVLFAIRSIARPSRQQLQSSCYE